MRRCLKIQRNFSLKVTVHDFLQHTLHLTHSFSSPSVVGPCGIFSSRARQAEIPKHQERSPDLTDKPIAPLSLNMEGSEASADRIEAEEEEEAAAAAVDGVVADLEEQLEARP